jgi:metallo-beta-lactamase family protein
VKKVFIVHGEFSVQQDFQKKLQAKGFGEVHIPALHQEFELM